MLRHFQGVCRLPYYHALKWLTWSETHFHDSKRREPRCKDIGCVDCIRVLERKHRDVSTQIPFKNIDVAFLVLASSHVAEIKVDNLVRPACVDLIYPSVRQIVLLASVAFKCRQGVTKVVKQWRNPLHTKFSPTIFNVVFHPLCPAELFLDAIEIRIVSLLNFSGIHIVLLYPISLLLCLTWP